MQHHYLKKNHLQFLKYGRYCWCILRTDKKSLQSSRIKKLGDYQDLYIQSDKLLLSDVFEMMYLRWCIGALLKFIRYNKRNIWRYSLICKSSENYMKGDVKNKESSCLKYLDVNNLYRWIMSEKLPINNYNFK